MHLNDSNDLWLVSLKLSKNDKYAQSKFELGKAKKKN